MVDVCGVLWLVCSVYRLLFGSWWLFVVCCLLLSCCMMFVTCWLLFVDGFVSVFLVMIVVWLQLCGVSCLLIVVCYMPSVVR